MKVIQVVPRRETATKLTTLLNTTERELLHHLSLTIVVSPGMVIDPVVLEGRHVRLESLSLDHHPQLCEVGLDEELWRWTSSQIRTAEEMRAYIEEALAAQLAGTARPFGIGARGG